MSTTPQKDKDTNGKTTLSPEALAAADAREREALGELAGELVEMRWKELRQPGSTFYGSVLAALSDRGWPLTALGRVTGESYADLQEILNSPDAAPSRLPADCELPVYPVSIVHDLRAAQRGKDMSPEVAAFVRRVDAAANRKAERFMAAGGDQDSYNLLVSTYTRPGLLGIGSEAIRRELDRGVGLRRVIIALGRGYTAVRKRLNITLDIEAGTVSIGEYQGNILRDGGPFVFEAVPTSPWNATD